MGALKIDVLSSFHKMNMKPLINFQILLVLAYFVRKQKRGIYKFLKKRNVHEFHFFKTRSIVKVATGSERETQCNRWLGNRVFYFREQIAMHTEKITK